MIWHRRFVGCRFSVLLAALFFPASSVAGEPHGDEIRSPNFSVVTDAGEGHGREVALGFEQMRAVFGALMTKANVSLPIPLQIVAFRNSKERKWGRLRPGLMESQPR